MITILMVSAKLATLGLLKVKILCNKGYYVIIFVYDVTNKILSRDSNYIADVVIRSKFGNSSFSMREFIITSISKGFSPPPILNRVKVIQLKLFLTSEFFDQKRN